MPPTNPGSSALAPLLDGNSAGEPIPELMRHGLQQLIELEVAVLGADRHERYAVRTGLVTATATGPGGSPSRWATSTFRSPSRMAFLKE